MPGRSARRATAHTSRRQSMPPSAQHVLSSPHAPFTTGGASDPTVAQVLLDSAALACPAETLLNAKDIHNFTALDYACDAALWPTAVRTEPAEGKKYGGWWLALPGLLSGLRADDRWWRRFLPQGRLCALGARPEECDRFARALEPAMAWPASVGEAAARRASAEAAPSVLSTLFEAAKWQAKSASIRVQARPPSRFFRRLPTPFNHGSDFSCIPLRSHGSIGWPQSGPTRACLPSPSAPLTKCSAGGPRPSPALPRRSPYRRCALCEADAASQSSQSR